MVVDRVEASLVCLIKKDKRGTHTMKQKILRLLAVALSLALCVVYLGLQLTERLSFGFLSAMYALDLGALLAARSSACSAR